MNSEKRPATFPPGDDNERKFTEYIKTAFPKCQITAIGKSILGRQIQMYKIGEGKRNILYVGAHHGSEYITASLLYDFIRKIAASAGSVYETDLKLFLSSFTFFTVPKLNPDGVDISLFGVGDNPLSQRQKNILGQGDFKKWKANARGVDLNHNYPYGFTEYKKIELNYSCGPSLTLYSGENAVSEPETSALMSLIGSVDFSLVVSLHSQGEEIYPSPGDDDYTMRVAERLGAELDYKILTPVGTAAYGGLCDYTGNTLRIPSYTLEVGRGENPLCEREYIRIRDKVVKALFRLPMYL